MLDHSLMSQWAAVALVALALGLIALHGAAGRGLRAIVFGLLALLLGTSYVAGERVLGNARPVAFEMLPAEKEAQVLFARAIEEQGIYMLLSAEQAPVYYRLPWDEETANQLRGALEQAERDQTALMYRFAPSLDDHESPFYAMPQPAMPDKAPPEEGLDYRWPGWEVSARRPMLAAIPLVPPSSDRRP
jgi:hypothetical protein